MITLRKALDRGHAEHGWLDSYHTFSFANYHDPNHMGFRDLRVINEDRVEADGGFPKHPHENMEIITYVLEGALEHQDSMGNQSIIRPGEVQIMSAGTGITHSEFNHSKTAPVHLLQIWILPGKKALKPSYDQKVFADNKKQGRLCLVASPDGRESSVTIHQDVNLYLCALNKDQKVQYEIPKNRHTWIQVTRGSLTCNDLNLQQGDGVSVSEEKILKLNGKEAAEILIFDLN